MAPPTLYIQFQKAGLIGLACTRRDLKRSLPISVACADGDDISAELHKAIKELKIGKLKRCTLVLHKQDFAIQHFSFPPANDSEIECMLELELRESLPVSVSEVCYGWENLGCGEGGQCNVEVYWTPMAKMSHYLEILRQAHLIPIAIVPTISGYRSIFKEVSSAGSSLRIVRSSPNEWELFQVGSSGKCLFGRGRGIPTSHLDGQRSLEMELTRSLESCCERFTEDSVDECRVSASEEAGGDIDVTRDLLAKVDTDSPVSFFPLLAAAAAITGDLVVRGDASSLSCNMMPKQIRRSREGRMRRRLSLQVGVLVFAAIALAIGNLWFYTDQMDRQFEQSKSEIATLRPVVEHVEAMQGRIASIREQIDYILSPVDALNQINTVLANNDRTLDGLYLDKLSYGAEGLITMEGHATNDITPWRFAELLGATEQFSVTQRPRISTRMYGGARAIRFQMAVTAVDNGASVAEEGS